MQPTPLQFTSIFFFFFGQRIHEHSFPHYFWNCLLNISRLDHPRVSFNVYYALTYLQIYPRMPHNAGDICVALWLTWQVCRVTASLIIPCRWRFPRLLRVTGSGTRSGRSHCTRITKEVENQKMNERPRKGDGAMCSRPCRSRGWRRAAPFNSRITSCEEI